MEGPEIPNNDEDLAQRCTMIFSIDLDITDKIFLSLDFKSLNNAEQVSKLWRDAIKKGKVWQKFLKQRVLQSFEWKFLLQSLQTQMHGVLTSKEDDIDHLEFKKVCFVISKKLMKLEENWKSNTNRIIKRECIIAEPCRVYGDYSAWRANTYRPTINRSLAFNSSWAITAGNDSKITLRNRFKLDEIVRELNIPINDAGRSAKISIVVANDNFIVVAFYFRSEVCVWDVATQNLLFVLDGNMLDENWDAIHSSLHQICLHGNSLFTMHGGGADVICTLYKISTNPEIKPATIFTDNLPVQAVESVFMDENFICIHVKVTSTRMSMAGDHVELDDRIETRTVSSFEIVSEIDPLEYIRVTTLPFIHYMGGVITVGYCGSGFFSKTIKLYVFDAKTGDHLRTIDYAQPFMAALKMIKNKYIVTCDHRGGLDVWDLKKILNQNESDGFLLNRMKEPTLDCDYDSIYDGLLFEADEYQVGLVYKFSRDIYSLHIRDFIGDWDFEEQV